MPGFLLSFDDAFCVVFCLVYYTFIFVSCIYLSACLSVSAILTPVSFTHVSETYDPLQAASGYFRSPRNRGKGGT